MNQRTVSQQPKLCLCTSQLKKANAKVIEITLALAELKELLNDDRPSRKMNGERPKALMREDAAP